MDHLLLIGEIFVDVTTSRPIKMRLGGIVHAARGLWAAEIPYSVAVVCPEYLIEEAQRYLLAHGCSEVFVIGIVENAPNVVLIDDVKETGPQGYEELLRDVKIVKPGKASNDFSRYHSAVIFPGAYSLSEVAQYLPSDCRVVVDVAYGVKSVAELGPLHGRIEAIVISTSSPLFAALGANDITELINAVKPITDCLLIKENRGGSRLFDLQTGNCIQVYAGLSRTVNSVGVGDVYTAVFAAFSHRLRDEAVWRGMQVATRYACTTFVEDLKRDVQRELKLAVDSVRELGGVNLPWHERRKFQIYLAAPDFSYVDRTIIESAVQSLEYHNFIVRRPVLENGEAEPQTPTSNLQGFYHSDLQLMRECSLVFAIPQQRDPGTLVEIGIAIALGIPVITFDPLAENANTMVVCGSNCYSSELDVCVNATFESVSKLRSKPE